MDPDKMRQCMSLGYSAKSKVASTIGQCKLRKTNFIYFGCFTKFMFSVEQSKLAVFKFVSISMSRLGRQTCKMQIPFTRLIKVCILPDLSGNWRGGWLLHGFGCHISHLSPSHQSSLLSTLFLTHTHILSSLSISHQLSLYPLSLSLSHIHTSSLSPWQQSMTGWAHNFLNIILHSLPHQCSSGFDCFAPYMTLQVQGLKFTFCKFVDLDDTCLQV